MERACLVAGAGSGIGRAVAERLERDGWRVLAVDRAAIDAALERFGRLDAVVANAGFQHVSRSRSPRRSAGTRSSRCC